jgi:hypothetical protein
MKKRLFFTIFLIFTLFLPLSAQVRMGNFSQQGPASQEMKDDGLVAAHPSLPLKTNLKVKNTSNNKEVNVIVTNRIGVSSSRIIDLSPAAYKALELKKGDIVYISVNQPVEIPAPVKLAEAKEPTPPPKVETAEPAPVQQQAPAPAQVASAQPQPAGAVVTSGQLPGINVVVTNSTPIYSGSGKESSESDKIIIINTTPPAAPVPAPIYARPSQSNAAYLAWMMAMTMEAREARASREEREVREARELREIREARAARLAREEREEREYREAREAREVREAREAREVREAREAREAQLAREERQIEEMRDIKASRDALASPVAVEEQEYGYLETREFFWY